jgi:hypothetical protein
VNVAFAVTISDFGARRASYRPRRLENATPKPKPINAQINPARQSDAPAGTDVLHRSPQFQRPESPAPDISSTTVVRDQRDTGAVPSPRPRAPLQRATANPIKQPNNAPMPAATPSDMTG